MKRANIIKSIIAISFCLLVGYLSGFATRSSLDAWFLTLKKPFFNPPSWVFAPVWFVLYVLMGYSFAIVWSSDIRSSKFRGLVRKAMVLFGIQLVLNALWAVLFFGFCNPFLALIEITLLWLMIYETYKFFKIINNFAAKLLLPYLAWVTFATILNGSFWFLNS